MNRILLLVLCSLIFNLAIAQNVAINNDGSFADANALLDLKSNDKGVLIPRMLKAQRNAIIAPQAGLLVYQTNDTVGFQYFDGLKWVTLANLQNDILWAKNGNNIYNRNIRFVGIGTINPLTRLHVEDSSVLFRSPSFLPIVAGLPPISGSGNRMMWYADKAAFRSGGLIGTHWDKDSIGRYSFAAGFNAKAKGIYSVALGREVNAADESAIVLGSFSMAKGINCNSIGSYNNINSTHSNAFGYFNNIADDYSTSVGNFNENQNQQSISYGNINKSLNYNSIAIGNNNYATGSQAIAFGNFDSSTSINSIAIGHINTALSTNTLAIGTLNKGSEANAVIIGVNNKNIGGGGGVAVIGHHNFASGFGSIALGINDSATANKSNAIGQYNTVKGSASSTFGNQNLVLGSSSFAFGEFNKAIANNTSLIGSNNNGQGEWSYLFGFNNLVAGQSCLALGTNNSLESSFSSAFGQGNNNKGVFSCTMGNFNNADAVNSFAIGNYNTANADYSFAIGRENKAIWPGTTVVGKYNDTLNTSASIFEVGNGFFGARSNAMTILANGNTGIGVPNPINAKVEVHSNNSMPQLLVKQESTIDYSRIRMRNGNNNRHWDIRAYTDAGTIFGDGLEFYNSGFGTLLTLNGSGNATLIGTLTQLSDARFKTSIKRLHNSLQKLQKLNGYTYQWKNENRDQTIQTGFLAQEVAQVFPELVSENSKGTLGVNYIGMIPILLESIKAQQTQIEALKKMLLELKKQK